MIQISTDKERLDINIIHEFLSKESYWSKGRDIETVKRSIDNSLCFGVYHDDAQIGFTKVVTDYAVFAWILDEIIQYSENKKISKGTPPTDKPEKLP